MWNLDLAFADVVSTSTDPRLAAVRLAWWRERLEELDDPATVPAEPRLQTVAAELRPRGVSGAELSQLEDAWLPLLEPFPWGETVSEGLRLRGRILFGVGARLLGAQSKEAQAPGELWSLENGAAHCSDRVSQNFLLAEARSTELPGSVRRGLRRLTVLAALAASDTRGRGGTGRVAAALLHRMTGRFPR